MKKTGKIITRGKEVTPFLDEAGALLENSVAERVYLNVNGQRNGMVIRGKSVDNPVLLFISGGPGVPEYWLNEAYKERYPNRIEDYFTVCWWDYAGEGLSFDPSLSSEELTAERLRSDALEVAAYLKERFHVPKIYLMAHSGGTGLGFSLAEQYPEEFYCYFSMGQMVKSECGIVDDGYQFMKKMFLENGENKKIEKMEGLLTERNGHKVLKEGISEKKWIGLLMKEGCATAREIRSDVTDLMIPQLFCSSYTLTEKINYWRGAILLQNSAYAKSEDLRIPLYENRKLALPVCFLSGTYDYITPVTQVKELCDKIEAEDKAFYEFGNSAHSPLWEENEKVLEVMRSYVK